MKPKNPPINQQINASEVILIDETGKSLGKLSYDQAMLLAYDRDVDLVAVNINAHPPVTKLMDYSKEIYKQEKQKRKQRAKQKTHEIKEIKLSIKIEKHDLETKARLAKKFLDHGHKVRLNLMLRGREMLFRDKVNEIFSKFLQLTNSEYEIPIKQERNMFKATIKPK